MSFEDYVYVGPLDDINFTIFQKYKTPTKYYCSFYRKELDVFRQDTKPLDKSYFDMLIPEKFVQSNVSKSNKNIIDTSVRQSKIYKDCELEIHSKYEYTRIINTKKIKPLQNSLECDISYDISLLKYDEGDHFNEFHYDTFTPLKI
jgi:hypothetical protein